VSLNDRFNFLYSGDKAIPEEATFPSGKAKDVIFSGVSLEKKCVNN